MKTIVAFLLLAVNGFSQVCVNWISGLPTPCNSSSGATTWVFATLSHLNCNGSLTANTGTSDKAAIQAILNTASATVPLVYVQDCMSAIDTTTNGLVVKSYTEIRGAGFNTGFSYLGSANLHQAVLITNANPLGIATPTDTSITLSNFYINGNYASGHGASACPDNLAMNSDCLLLSLIRMVGVNYLTLNNLYSYQGMLNNMMSNVFNYRAENIYCANNVSNAYTDCLDVFGPADYGYIHNISGANGDDLICICADEIHLASCNGGCCVGCFGNNALASTIKQGAITELLVDGIFPNGSGTAFRLISNTSLIDNLVIRNVVGASTIKTFEADCYPAGFLGCVGNYGRVVIDNVGMYSPNAAPGLGAYFRSLTLNRVSNNTYYQPAKTFVTTSSTIIDNFEIYLNASSNVVNIHGYLDFAAGTFQAVKITGGFNPGNTTNQSTFPPITMEGGTIAILEMDFTADHINSIWSQTGGTVTKMILRGAHTNANGNATIVNSAGTITELDWCGFPTALLTSGAGTISNIIGCVIGAAITAQAAIANTETQVVGLTLPANYLQVGSTYHIHASGNITTGVTAGSSIFRIRIGTTTLTGNIPATVTVANNASVTTQPFSLEAYVTVRTTGATGSILGDVFAYDGGAIATGAFANAGNGAVATSTVAVDTTAIKILELTYISGNAGSTATFQGGSISAVKI